MNRTALNSGVIGSGNSVSLVRLAATTVLQLVGALRVSVAKTGRATQEHVLAGSVHFAQVLTGAATSALELVGSLSGHVLSPVFASAAQFHHLAGSLRGMVEVPLRGAIDHVLGDVFSASTLRFSPLSVRQEHTLEGVLSGEDYFSGPAPQERSVSITRATRFVAVGAASTSTGV